jgi:hypothetical protein
MFHIMDAAAKGGITYGLKWRRRSICQITNAKGGTTHFLKVESESDVSDHGHADCERETTYKLKLEREPASSDDGCNCE